MLIAVHPGLARLPAVPARFSRAPCLTGRTEPAKEQTIELGILGFGLLRNGMAWASSRLDALDGCRHDVVGDRGIRRPVANELAGLIFRCDPHVDKTRRCDHLP